MPIAENSAASSGIEITPAQKRGATTRAIGSTAIISIAEICSVAFIRPISAVIADAGAAREQQPRDHRPELAHQRQRDQDAERLRGAVALQRVVALQAEHHADEQPRHQDDDQRQHAGEIDLAHGELEAAERGARVQQDVDEEARGEAQAPDLRAGGMSEALERLGAARTEGAGSAMLGRRRRGPPRSPAPGKWNGIGPSVSPCTNWRTNASPERAQLRRRACGDDPPRRHRSRRSRRCRSTPATSWLTMIEVWPSESFSVRTRRAITPSEIGSRPVNGSS